MLKPAPRKISMLIRYNHNTIDAGIKRPCKFMTANCKEIGA